MRHALLIAFVLFPTALLAQSDQPQSPKDALLAQDTAAQAGDLDADAKFYYAASDHQRDLLKFIAQGDVALAKLQSAVAKQFGKELALEVVHAAGTVVSDDVKAATEKVDGDKATVTFKNDATPLHMVKIDGAWKVSLPDMLGEATPPQLEKLAEKFTAFTTEINHLTDLVTHEKFRSGQGVRDRVQDLHDRLFKPDQDTPDPNPPELAFCCSCS
jgi:hypothetical protein